MFFRVFVLALALVCATSAIGQKPAKKKNKRPPADVQAKTEVREADPPVFFYEFVKPEFVVSRIRIEHDENGRGRIFFRKKNMEEEFARPLSLSDTTVTRLKTHWSNLDFLASSKNYQSKKQYPHLGTVKLTMKVDDLSRTAEFNWTDDPDARVLYDHYRKIGYQYVWMFDIDVARKNQPLESPRLMKELDTYLRLGSISDPVAIVPFLLELVDDERMPLIARNHAKRLAENIKKNENDEK